MGFRLPTTKLRKYGKAAQTTTFHNTALLTTVPFGLKSLSVGLFVPGPVIIGLADGWRYVQPVACTADYPGGYEIHQSGQEPRWHL